MSDERPPQSHGGRRRAPRNARGRRGVTSKGILVPVVGALAAIAVLLILLTNCQGGFNAGNTPATPPTTSTPTITQPVVVPPTTPTATHSATPTPTPTKTTAKPTTSASPTPTPTSTAAELTTVRVYNGTLKVGLAASYAKKLKASGWTIATVANWGKQDIKTTVIYYPTGQKAAAEKLAKEVGHGVVKPATGTAASAKALTLVLGSDAG